MFRLELPALPEAGIYCLSFAYHMYGFHIATLAVHTYSPPTDLSPTPAWQQSGEQGELWLTASTSVSVGVNERLVFIGRRGGEYSGDIGLDSIVLRAGEC